MVTNLQCFYFKEMNTILANVLFLSILISPLACQLDRKREGGRAAMRFLPRQKSWKVIGTENWLSLLSSTADCMPMPISHKTSTQNFDTIQRSAKVDAPGCVIAAGKLGQE